ncbi:MAG: DUF4147 domain-containing protein [Candidatus Liptonbacteria bacterium]
MKIKNFDSLATTPLRRDALSVLEAGLEAIDTYAVIKDNVSLRGDELIIRGKQIELSDGKLIVVGIGKCALEAGAELERVLGKKLSGGIIFDVHSGTLKKLRTFTGDHPFPTERNIDATKVIIDTLKDLKENDTVIFVISGGGSTLLCQPQNHTCKEERIIVETLFAAGATIQEMNTVRKHTSLARGGYLAEYAYPAKSVSLIFSDVPGDDIVFIASGPTVLDKTTINDAEKISDKYKLKEKLGADLEFIETPKEQKYFDRVTNILAVSNQTALTAMSAGAVLRGYNPQIVTSNLQGEARKIGEGLAKKISEMPSGTMLLCGGETTVTITGSGKGGRNQEVVLGAIAAGLLESTDELIISCGTDGRDNTDKAGAVGDNAIAAKAESLGLSAKQFLDENNSYEFFSQAGGHIDIGLTGSNVSDVIIAVKGKVSYN